MDVSLVTSLLNLGGVGVLAAALLLLHREALKAFRQELSEERLANRQELAIERQVSNERHENIMATLQDHREDSKRDHKETRHAVRDLANVVGLAQISKSQVHRASGGPPGSIVVETSPQTITDPEEP